MTVAIRSTLVALAEAPTVEGPLRLRSEVDAPATTDEVLDAGWDPVPRAAAEFWQAARSATLFRDIDYGQWGLRFFDPRASRDRTLQERSSRPHDFKDGDVVVAEFLGDQELLVLEANGAPRVAPPLDPRQAWYRPADDLAGFLANYAKAQGAKYWEPRPRDIP